MSRTRNLFHTLSYRSAAVIVLCFLFFAAKVIEENEANKAASRIRLLFGLTKMLINQLIDILEKVFCQGVSKWLVKVLPNVWQKFFQRLAMVLPNVWQWYCPTFDKSLFNVWQECFQTFDKGLFNV